MAHNKRLRTLKEPRMWTADTRRRRAGRCEIEDQIQEMEEMHEVYDAEVNALWQQVDDELEEIRAASYDHAHGLWIASMDLPDDEDYADEDYQAS